MISKGLLIMLAVLIAIYLVTIVSEYIAIYFGKIKIHIERWNEWRKINRNSKFHKFLVLIGLQVSPTMVLVLTKDEIAKIDILQEDRKE